jgi:hypothetical protein
VRRGIFAASRFVWRRGLEVLRAVERLRLQRRWSWTGSPTRTNVAVFKSAPSASACRRRMESAESATITRRVGRFGSSESACRVAVSALRSEPSTGPSGASRQIRAQAAGASCVRAPVAAANSARRSGGVVRAVGPTGCVDVPSSRPTGCVDVAETFAPSGLPAALTCRRRVLPAALTSRRRSRRRAYRLR